MSKSSITPGLARIARWLPKATFRAKRRFQSWPGDVDIEPLANVIQLGPKRFCAESSDPQLSLRLPRMPVGPTLFEIQVASDQDYPFDLQLFYDTGAGWSAAQSLHLSALGEGKLKHVLHLPKKVQALRLDVGCAMGEFSIEKLRLREISASEAWLAERSQPASRPADVVAPAPAVATFKTAEPTRHFVLTDKSLLVPTGGEADNGAAEAALVAAPEATGELTFAFDQLSYDPQTRRINARGWAFPAARTSARHSVKLVLVGPQGAWMVPTRPMIRHDVRRAFDSTWLAYTGFYQATILPQLPAGEYRAGLLVERDEPREDLALLAPTTESGFAVRTLDELDEELRVMAALQERSLEDWIIHGQLFYWGEDTTNLPADPFSDAYRKTQLDLYEEVSGRNGYNPWASEPFNIDVASAADPYPFPYSTRDAEFVGNHMLALGHIMRVMKATAPTAKSVIEFGCGTGFTTIVLAQTGFDVTAVDINADALAVLNRLAQTRGLPLNTHNGVFGEVPESTPPADVVLFYEAFHHCWDFQAVLERLHTLVRENGVVILAGEPIIPDFPKAWGLRLGGQALWEIRTKGWLELGFKESFFLDLLARTGWSAAKHCQENSPDIYVLRRKS
jgi:SAM-dependent methyltransferase